MYRKLRESHTHAGQSLTACNKHPLGVRSVSGIKELGMLNHACCISDATDKGKWKKYILLCIPRRHRMKACQHEDQKPSQKVTVSPKVSKTRPIKEEENKETKDLSRVGANNVNTTGRPVACCFITRGKWHIANKMLFAPEWRTEDGAEVGRRI